MKHGRPNPNKANWKDHITFTRSFSQDLPTSQAITSRALFTNASSTLAKPNATSLPQKVWATVTSTVSPTSLLQTIAAQSPKSHKVTVGGGGSLSFSPNHLRADPGDIVEFTFFAKNHTLTSSSFGDPCKARGGFDSGFSHFNPQNRSDDKLIYVVQHSDPQWFFCSQDFPINHCAAGMVFALNPTVEQRDSNPVRIGHGNLSSPIGTRSESESLQPATNYSLPTILAMPESNSGFSVSTPLLSLFCLLVLCFLLIYFL